MDYPIHRKYPNGKHFFRIRSETEYDELFIIGRRYGTRKKVAETYPDRLMIQDMIAMEGESYLESSREEFEAMMEKCEREMIPLQSS